MGNLFDNINSYDKFISQIKFSINTLQSFKEKIEYKNIIHQTNVFFKSLQKQEIIKSFKIEDDKKDICHLKNGLLTIIKIKLESDNRIKEDSLKQLFKLYNLDYKYASFESSSRLVIVEFKFENWVKDSFKDY